MVKALLISPAKKRTLLLLRVGTDGPSINISCRICKCMYVSIMEEITERFTRIAIHKKTQRFITLQSRCCGVFQYPKWGDRGICDGASFSSHVHAHDKPSPFLSLSPSLSPSLPVYFSISLFFFFSLSLSLFLLTHTIYPRSFSYTVPVVPRISTPPDLIPTPTLSAHPSLYISVQLLATAHPL